MSQVFVRTSRLIRTRLEGIPFSSFGRALAGLENERTRVRIPVGAMQFSHLYLHLWHTDEIQPRSVPCHYLR